MDNLQELVDKQTNDLVEVFDKSPTELYHYIKTIYGDTVKPGYEIRAYKKEHVRSDLNIECYLPFTIMEYTDDRFVIYLNRYNRYIMAPSPLVSNKWKSCKLVVKTQYDFIEDDEL
jgi:hypothetical protein